MPILLVFLYRECFWLNITVKKLEPQDLFTFNLSIFFTLSLQPKTVQASQLCTGAYLVVKT